MPLSGGTRLGPYEIVAPLGKGGMGEVYRARDARLGRDVAIKVVQRGEADPSLWGRFEQEARAASALSHPNICSVFDTGEAEGQPYLVMELLEGQTLQQLIGTRPLETDAAVNIGVQIADALEAAHAKGILHRDIKPGNVMIIGRGHVKVLDFGLAKTAPIGPESGALTLRTDTETGFVLGTPAYLPPEVLQGLRADARADLWALGVVLYQMLSGTLPFPGATTFEISSGILKDQPPALPHGVPPRLGAIVERCLEKQPEKRYHGASELRLALEALQASAATPPQQPAQRRRPWLWAGAAVIAIAAFAAVFVWHPRAGGKGLVGSTGAPVSVNQEANDIFELGVNLQTIQNDIPKAQEAFERAYTLDPHFSEARRYHAMNHVVLLLNGFSNDVNELYHAEADLRQVARDSPHAFNLRASQAAVYMAEGRKYLVPLQQLEQEDKEHPLQGDSIVWGVIFRMLADQDGAAKDLAQKTLKREPLMAPVRMFLGEILRTEGDTAGAIREQKKVMEQAPGNITSVQFLVHAYLDNGELAEARKLLEARRPEFSGNYMWRQSWALLLAAEGKHEEALKAMDDETLKFAAAAFVATSVNAEFYAVLGDTPRAIEWLDKAVRNGDERVAYFQRNPRLASIRKEPAFRRIIDSIEARRASQPQGAH